jgi:hypothetical protein
VPVHNTPHPELLKRYQNYGIAVRIRDGIQVEQGAVGVVAPVGGSGRNLGWENDRTTSLILCDNAYVVYMSIPLMLLSQNVSGQKHFSAPKFE